MLSLKEASIVKESACITWWWAEIVLLSYKRSKLLFLVQQQVP